MWMDPASWDMPATQYNPIPSTPLLDPLTGVLIEIQAQWDLLKFCRACETELFRRAFRWGDRCQISSGLHPC